MDQIILYLRDCLHYNKQRYNRLHLDLWKIRDRSSDRSLKMEEEWSLASAKRSSKNMFCLQIPLIPILIEIQEINNRFQPTLVVHARGKYQIACMDIYNC